MLLRNISEVWGGGERPGQRLTGVTDQGISEVIVKTGDVDKESSDPGGTEVSKDLTSQLSGILKVHPVGALICPFSLCRPQTMRERL